MSQPDAASADAIRQDRRFASGPWPWIAAAVTLLAAALLNLGAGPTEIPPSTLLRLLISRLPGLSLMPDWPATFQTIIFDIRLPHTLLIGLAGLALGGSGAAYQGLFRNPLADPYILGVASGAGLGAVLAMSLAWPQDLLGLAAVPAAAFGGALLTTAMVYLLARTGQTAPATTLILAGVAVGILASALTSLVLLLASDELRRAISWLLGGFSIGGWGPPLISLPYLAVSLGVLVAIGRPLDVLQVGEEQALQLGLDVARLRRVTVIAASMAAATAVAFAGIIGFVGLIVPHIVRLLWGPDHRRLIPLSCFGGAIMLWLADMAARTVLAPRSLPVGIVTAVIGVPFFLVLLRRSRREFYG